MLPRQLSTNFSDTLASELGILASMRPIHILTFHPVPPGTNGGVTPHGLFASVLGGLVMGLVFAFDLYLENRPACSSRGLGWAVDLCFFGMLAGTMGSLVSVFLFSFLG